MTCFSYLTDFILAGFEDNNTFEFVQGDFLASPLPFPAETFDLVRISCLTYTIPYDKWEGVLRECGRVLSVGGRVEVVDDHVFFPYASSSSSAEDLDGDGDDTATLHGLDQDEHSKRSVARTLETLFEEMHNLKYGIHLCPSQFLVGMMEGVLGHAREGAVWHLVLAPPRPAQDSKTPSVDDTEIQSPTDAGGMLRNSPGLVLWPSTFIPLPKEEVEAAALRHPRYLLGLGKALVEYAGGESDHGEEGGEAKERAVREALWEYEEYLHGRFDPSRTGGGGEGRQGRPGSFMSLSSVSSEGQSALREYQMLVQVSVFSYRRTPH